MNSIKSVAAAKVSFDFYKVRLGSNGKGEHDGSGT